MADEPPEDAIMEEREELMVSPTGGQPTRRVARFLKPHAFNLPPHCLSFGISKPQSEKSPLKVNFNGWRNPPRTWKIWVDRMSSLHQSLWKKLGIYDSIMSSTYTFRKDSGLIYKIAKKWCSETKSFVFPFGESTVTLEDMVILGGYPVLGDSVLMPLEGGESEEIREKLLEARRELVRSRAQKADHYSWINKFMGSGSEIEHEAFLCLWLSRFVFPASPSDAIGKNVFPIALHLARGTKIGLAPAVLAALYRDLNLLKDRIVAPNESGIEHIEKAHASELTVLAPFQLLQIWVWERFPTLRPKPNDIACDEPRLARWHMAKKLETESVESAVASGGKCFRWRPYAITVNQHFFHKLYGRKEEWLQVGSVMGEEVESFARCVRVSELVGLDCVVQYLPHRVALQFGMDQDLPGNVARCNSTPEIAWENYSRPIRDVKLCVPSPFFESDVTTRYLEWWERMKGGVKQKSRESKIDRDSQRLHPTSTSDRKMADWIPTHPPGFFPKHNGKMAHNYPAITPKCISKRSANKDLPGDEDSLTVSQLLKKMTSSDDKPLDGRQLKIKSSSTCGNGSTLPSLELMKTAGKKIANHENVVQPETVGADANESRAGTPLKNGVSLAGSQGEGNARHGVEIPEFELANRITRLEGVVARLKASTRFGVEQVPSNHSSILK